MTPKPPPPSPKWPPSSDPVLEARLQHHETWLDHLSLQQCSSSPKPSLDQIPVGRLVYLFAIGLMAMLWNLSPEIVKALIQAAFGKL